MVRDSSLNKGNHLDPYSSPARCLVMETAISDNALEVALINAAENQGQQVLFNVKRRRSIC